MGRLKWIWVSALALLPFVVPAITKADTVTVDGSYLFANGGYGIPPYGGTLNGQHESLYCVDFSTPFGQENRGRSRSPA